MNIPRYFEEQKVYQERNGQVVDDEDIKKTIIGNKMIIEGYANDRPIYYVKDLTPKSRSGKNKKKRKKNRKTKSKRR